MLKWFFIVSLSSFWNISIDIKTINSFKEKAELAFNQKDYVSAANYYHALIDSFGVDETELKLNLAHSYFKASETELAEKSYQQLSFDDNKLVSSVANKQLGSMFLEKKKYKEALNYYKEALKRNPTEYENQYNYELMKKIIKKQEQQKQDQEKDQDKKDQNNKDQKDKKNQQKQQKNEKKQNKNEQNKKEEKEGEDKKKKKQNESGGDKNKDQKDKDSEKKEGEKKENLQKGDKSENERNEEKKQKNNQQKQQKERFQKINMTPAKVKMILDAMKNNETKYYQQLKKKSAKKQNRSKPDW